MYYDRKYNEEVGNCFCTIVDCCVVAPRVFLEFCFPAAYHAIHHKPIYATSWSIASHLFEYRAPVDAAGYQAQYRGKHILEDGIFEDYIGEVE